MHELSIAQGLLERALGEAAQYEGQRIVALHIKVGQEAHLEPGALEFCLAALAQGTTAEGARIHIQLAPAMARCAGCGLVFPMLSYIGACPNCQAPSLQRLAGSGVWLESLEVAERHVLGDSRSGGGDGGGWASNG